MIPLFPRVNMGLIFDIQTAKLYDSWYKSSNGKKMDRFFEELVPFVEAQIQSTYPLTIIERAKEDPIKEVQLEVTELDLRKGPFYPIALSSLFKDIDPMSSILSILSK